MAMCKTLLEKHQRGCAFYMRGTPFSLKVRLNPQMNPQKLVEDRLNPESWIPKSSLKTDWIPKMNPQKLVEDRLNPESWIPKSSLKTGWIPESWIPFESPLNPQAESLNPSNWIPESYSEKHFKWGLFRNILSSKVFSRVTHTKKKVIKAPMRMFQTTVPCTTSPSVQWTTRVNTYGCVFLA